MKLFLLAHNCNIECSTRLTYICIFIFLLLSSYQYYHYYFIYNASLLFSPLPDKCSACECFNIWVLNDFVKYSTMLYLGCFFFLLLLSQCKLVNVFDSVLRWERYWEVHPVMGLMLRSLLTSFVEKLISLTWKSCWRIMYICFVEGIDDQIKVIHI